MQPEKLLKSLYLNHLAHGKAAVLPPQRVRILIQARTGSSRLPGKVLANLAGRPLLEYVVERLCAADPGWEVTVATTTAPADEAVVSCCRRLGIRSFRGSEADVLGRFVAASADLADGDLVVRATADNPLYCPKRTADIVAEHCRVTADYTCVEGLSYVVPEVMTVGALRSMAAVATDAYCREHVTPFFRQCRQAFRVLQLPADWLGLRPDVRLTIDTPEELERMAGLCQTLAAGNPLFPLDDVYSLLDGSLYPVLSE